MDRQDSTTGFELRLQLIQDLKRLLGCQNVRHDLPQRTLDLTFFEGRPNRRWREQRQINDSGEWFVPFSSFLQRTENLFGAMHNGGRQAGELRYVNTVGSIPRARGGLVQENHSVLSFSPPHRR